MRIASSVATLGCVLLMLVFTFRTQAQPLPTFTEYSWVGSAGANNWQDGANWDLAGFPNELDPNDMDYPTANLAVPLSGNLNASVGTTPVTIAGLTLGGTSSAVTSEISSGAGGQLIFRNDFVSDFSSPDNDADFNNNDRVLGGDFLIWQQNLGATNPDAATESNYNDHGDADADNDVIPTISRYGWNSMASVRTRSAAMTRFSSAPASPVR